MKISQFSALRRLIAPVAFLLFLSSSSVAEADEPKPAPSILQALDALPVHPDPHRFDGSDADWLITEPAAERPRRSSHFRSTSTITAG